MSKIDAILWSLRDGKGHSLTEIIEKSPLPNPLMKMALSFLREFNFIQIDENEQKVKLFLLLFFVMKLMHTLAVVIYQVHLDVQLKE